MNKLVRWSKLVAINLVLLVALAELAGVAHYWNAASAWFYSRQPANPEDYRNRPLNVVFHPFFGYVARNDGRYTNNDGFGFIERERRGRAVDYPFAARPDEVVIGVFGGSVAQEFFHHQEKFNSLEGELAKLGTFARRHPVVLNFAFSGYKQPQQLGILGYYLARGQHFDVVLNLDGFNEVAHGADNFAKKVPVAAPVDSIWGALARHVEQTNVNVGNGYGAMAQALTGSRLAHRRQASQCRLASCYLYYTALAMADDGRLRRAVSKSGATIEEWRQRSYFVMEQDHDPTGAMARWPVPDQAYAEAASQWAEAAAVSDQMARALGFVFVDVLQPNLHFPRNRRFQFAGVENADYVRYAESVRRSYPLMVEKVAQLRQRGVWAVDGTAALDGEADTILKDACCHYNDEGYASLSRFIAREIDMAARRRMKP